MMWHIELVAAIALGVAIYFISGMFEDYHEKQDTWHVRYDPRGGTQR